MVYRREAAKYVTDVLTAFRRLLWSTTVQINGNMESICFVWWQSKILKKVVLAMCLPSNRWYVSMNQSKCIHNLAFHINRTFISFSNAVQGISSFTNRQTLCQARTTIRAEFLISDTVSFYFLPWHCDYIFTVIIIMTLQDNSTSKLKKTRKHHVNTLNNIMVVFLRSVPRFHYITKRKNLE